jgi:hypothetical protein
MRVHFFKFQIGFWETRKTNSPIGEKRINLVSSSNTDVRISTQISLWKRVRKNTDTITKQYSQTHENGILG